MLRQWWKRHTDDADEGAATAEFAVVLPCVAAVAILVLCLGRASVVSMNLFFQFYFDFPIYM